MSFSGESPRVPRASSTGDTILLLGGGSSVGLGQDDGSACRGGDGDGASASRLHTTRELKSANCPPRFKILLDTWRDSDLQVVRCRLRDCFGCFILPLGSGFPLFLGLSTEIMLQSGSTGIFWKGAGVT